jgi:hypothetical protein
MKSLNLVAVLLAATLAGFWVRSESPQSPTSTTPQSVESPATVSNPEIKTQPSAQVQSAGRVGAAHPSALGTRTQTPSADLDQKLAQNEQQLAIAQDQLFHAQDAIRTSDLDSRIQQQQQVVLDLQARANTMGKGDASTLQNQAILVDQSNQLLQQRIAGLQQQIQNQQGISNNIELQLRHTIAPDDSDIMNSLRDQFQASERQRKTLVDEYNSVLQQQQQLAVNRYANQAQAQQAQQAGTVSTDLAFEQAKGQLEDLKRQQQMLQSDADQSQKRVQSLQAERASLLSQSH